MSIAENLREILDKQKELVSGLESRIVEIEANDLVSENEQLKAELIAYRALLDRENSNSLCLTEENKRLKNQIYEQLYNEKLQLLNHSVTKAEIYFKSNVDGELNRLSSVEAQAKKQIDEMTACLAKSRLAIEEQLLPRLNEIREKIHSETVRARAESQLRSQDYSESIHTQFDTLRSEQLTDAQISKRVNKNNLEAFIGLNVMNKLGILILIIGVIAASQFTYLRLNDIQKSVFAFVIGITMLVAGEAMNRRKPDIFSLGITSGGVAVLYVALVISYFRFGILTTWPALGLCVLITAVAFVLSQRYHSQTITVFAMIGGYLPIFSISGNEAMVYGAMVYFIVLNILALLIAINRKWIITAYIGYVLNVAGTVYITAIMFEDRLFSINFHPQDLITITYICFTFVIYTLIPVAGSYVKKLRFKNADIVLLALNTCISSAILYAVFYLSDLSDFHGLLAVVFAGVYLALGRFIEKQMASEQKAKALFYLTGLTFVVLVVPLQFGSMWLSLGWLVEGVALLSYGIYAQLRVFKRAGLAISLLCLASFVLFDVLNPFRELFSQKYFAVTAGSMIILGLLMIKKNLYSKVELGFKYAATVNLWFYLLYVIVFDGKTLLYQWMRNSSYNPDYLIFAALIIVSYVLAYTIPRVKLLHDKVMKWISLTIYTIALYAVFQLNTVSPTTIHLDTAPLTVLAIGTIELAIITLLSLLALREVVLCILSELKHGLEWYPLLLSLYFMLALTQLLVSQYSISINNLIIGILYLITALVWITFGFFKRYVMIRRFGLGLSVLSVAKLFLIDLSFLTEGYRILSYFVFGVTLLAISFVYQYFTKKIDTIGEVKSNAKKADR